MLHKQLRDGDYYSVGVSSNKSKVLLQLGNKHGDQARVVLTESEAMTIIADLCKQVGKVVFRVRKE